MPLYQGGGLTARRNAAGHAVEAAQSTVQRTRLDVRQKLLEARSQVMSCKARCKFSRQEALSARTRELYQQQYLDLGSRPLLDVLNAEQRSIRRASHPAAETLGQLHQLQLNCLYNTGQLRHAFDLDNRTIQTVEIQP